MNINDRIALEIGRAVLAKLIAEAQRDELAAQLAAANPSAAATPEGGDAENG